MVYMVVLGCSGVRSDGPGRKDDGNCENFLIVRTKSNRLRGNTFLKLNSKTEEMGFEPGTSGVRCEHNTTRLNRRPPGKVFTKFLRVAGVRVCVGIPVRAAGVRVFS